MIANYSKLVFLKCPYCGFLNKYMIETAVSGYSHPQVVTCDSEEGGCDRYFAVRLQLIAQAEVFEMTEAHS